MLNISTKNETEDEEFNIFKQKIKSSQEYVNDIKYQIRKYEELLIKIKDYKTHNPLEYLSVMNELGKLSFGNNDRSKV